MNADIVLQSLVDRGCRLFSGVPCSYLTPLINAAIDSPLVQYVNAANEGEAVAIASGAQLGGWLPVVMFQNSGLSNALSPLTSLNHVFRIPVLLIVTWRGQPGGPPDEPQHALVGQIMPQLLETLQIPFARFPDADHQLDAVLDRAVESMQSSGRPFALLLEKGIIDPHDLATGPPQRRRERAAVAASQARALEVDPVIAVIGAAAARHQAAVLATTGFTGRALYQWDDRDNHLYMVGSMGCVSSLALGLALARPERQVIAIDGDGALLMRMGALGAVAAAGPPNLTHVVLDNGVHDSTGAQTTLSHTVDIGAAAAACGYPRVEFADSLEVLQSLLARPADSLQMITVRTHPRADRRLPRPSIAPHEVASRLRQFMSAEQVVGP